MNIPYSSPPRQDSGRALRAHALGLLDAAGKQYRAHRRGLARAAQAAERHGVAPDEAAEVLGMGEAELAHLVALYGDRQV